MPTSTTDRGLPVPIGSDPDDVPSDLLTLANRLKKDLSVSYGTEAARPAAPSGLWEAYVATDTGRAWFSVGSTWLLVGPDAVSNSSITSAKLANLAVTTAKLADGAVTTAKLGAKSVTWDKIADNTIGSGQLALSAVETQNIKAKAVTRDKLADGAVVASGLFSAIPTATGSHNYYYAEDRELVYLDVASGVWRMVSSWYLGSVVSDYSNISTSPWSSTTTQPTVSVPFSGIYKITIRGQALINISGSNTKDAAMVSVAAYVVDASTDVAATASVRYMPSNITLDANGRQDIQRLEASTYANLSAGVASMTAGKYVSATGSSIAAVVANLDSASFSIEPAQSF